MYLVFSWNKSIKLFFTTGIYHDLDNYNKIKTNHFEFEEISYKYSKE